MHPEELLSGAGWHLDSVSAPKNNRNMVPLGAHVYSSNDSTTNAAGLQMKLSPVLQPPQSLLKQF